jgi:hypothetical protein
MSHSSSPVVVVPDKPPKKKESNDDIIEISSSEDSGDENADSGDEKVETIVRTARTFVPEYFRIPIRVQLPVRLLSLLFTCH